MDSERKVDPHHHNGIFVISSDPVLKNYLRMFLTHFGYPLYCSEREDEAPVKIRELTPKLVVLDSIPPDAQWANLEKAVLELKPQPAVLILTDPKGIESGQMPWEGNGLYYVRRPFDTRELKETVQQLMMKVQGVPTKKEDIDLWTGSSTQIGQSASFSILGISKQHKEILHIVDQVVGTDVTVLIRGESGTGKELIARRIHERSVRRDKPFIKVLCPAIPETLLESELFGYERGSFTGALTRKPGRFEFANEGTMFLDEIGDIPFSLQSKLLQVLQEGEFARIGGKKDIRVNVRIIAATNRDLEKAVREGSFREDLFYRLDVVNIHMPPLRDRKEDIPVLVRFFLDRFNRQFNKRMELSHDSMKLFMEYHWPGNVRELENTLESIVIIDNEKEAVWRLRSLMSPHRRFPVTHAREDAAASPATMLSSQDRRQYERRWNKGAASSVEANPADSVPFKKISRDAARMVEQELIKKALDQTRWNRKAASILLKISYKALLYKIRQCNLEGESVPSKLVQ